MAELLPKQVWAGLGVVGLLTGIGALAYFNSRRKAAVDEEPDEAVKEHEGLRAAKKYEEIQWGHKPDKVLRYPGGRRMFPKYLVDIGELDAVVYRSGKSGALERYIHFFTQPRPRLTTTSEGNELYVVGGQPKVTEHGIVG